MPSPISRSITALAAAAAFGVAALGATAGPPVDTAVATTVALPACDPVFAIAPATDRQADYVHATAQGTVEVTAARRKAVEVRACLVSGEPAKVRLRISAFKAPRSARYVTAVTDTTTVFRDGTTRQSAADIALPATEAGFDRWIRRIPERVALSIPGIGGKVYVPRGDVLTTIAKRQNGKRITDGQRAAAAKAVLAELPEPAPSK